MSTLKWNTRQHLLASMTFLLAPVLALATTDTGTLLVGSGTIGPHATITSYGYIASSWGSYSPTGLTGGGMVFEISDFYNNISGNWIEAAFEGTFSSNPGQGWLTSISCNGVTNTGTSATYGYTGGIASWSWTSSSNNFGLKAKNGTNVGCTIVHT